MTRRWKERWQQGRRGAVTVEMGLVLPVSTMLTTRETGLRLWRSDEP